MVSDGLSVQEIEEFCRCVDHLASRPDLAVYYRAGYFGSMIATMSEQVPGVAEFVRNRMSTMQKPVDNAEQSGNI